jgi:hypothetical protein
VCLQFSCRAKMLSKKWGSEGSNCVIHEEFDFSV